MTTTNVVSTIFTIQREGWLKQKKDGTVVSVCIQFHSFFLFVCFLAFSSFVDRFTSGIFLQSRRFVATRKSPSQYIDAKVNKCKVHQQVFAVHDSDFIQYTGWSNENCRKS